MTRKFFTMPAADVLPSLPAVLERQGIPQWKNPDERTVQLAQDAIALYQGKATPLGVTLEITKEEFKTVFEGEGRNEVDSPVGLIFQASTHLALFAVTIGQEICSEILRLFKTTDFAPGSMLDSTASEGAELTAQVVELLFSQHLKESGKQSARERILRFSPGYCGWHISAQKKLFDILLPGEIGITLNESYLMQPLKSISGVIISGEKDIFYFDDTFSFCRHCADHTCRERLQSIMD